MTRNNGHTPHATATISVEIPPAGVAQPADVHLIDLNRIDANPWQPRLREDPAHIKTLAESIAANGLLQIPSARPHPTQPGRYQLAFGHSRKAAFEFLRDATDQRPRFASMPLNIVAMTDQGMANAAAAENIARKDLSAIEIATAIQRYIADFGATQLEAGKVYGYTSQSSVSNLLRLLQLPEPVQRQVNEGKMPERYARELIVLGKANEAAAVQVAESYITAAEHAQDEDSVRGAFSRMLSSAYDKNGVTFNDSKNPAHWDLNWPGKPIMLVTFEKEQQFEVPACRGCPFFVDHAQEYYRRCLRPKCFKVKGELWLQHALDSASKKLGIPIQSKGEKTEIAWNGVDDILGNDEASKAIKAKDPTLRLAPFALKKGSYDYAGNHRERALGFNVIMLMTTNPTALRKSYKPEEKPKTETAWERENRIRNERRKHNLKACELAAPHLAVGLSVPNVLVDALHETCDYIGNDDRKKWEERGIDARRADIMRMVLEKFTNADAYQDTPSGSTVIEQINELARSLKVKLPNGWQHEATAVPVNGKAKRGKK